MMPDGSARALGPALSAVPTPAKLRISISQFSDKGRKESNQDFHGVCIPDEPLLSTKGVAIALADGISSSEVSHIASESAVRGFLDDYYCTSEAWSARTSAQRVLSATNSWLYAQTRKSSHEHDMDRGYVCTLSAMVIKSTTAHLFHVGDTRIYRLRGNTLEQLTEDHRLWVSAEKSYLSRAMGIEPVLEMDYRTLPVEHGDRFLLATDGVYEHVDTATLQNILRDDTDFHRAAQNLVEIAHENGSPDNLTAQILRIDDLPQQESEELYRQLTDRPFPPALGARMEFDGYRIVRELHASDRSHAWLAIDRDTDKQVVIKTPSIELRDNLEYLESFLLEEWVARRINSAHVLKAPAQTRARNFLYSVTEYIEGQTLAQWMRDHPKPDLKTVRDLISQIAQGLQAFHRMEMIHQDLRPENILIDDTGTVKIIDFGSTRVAGIAEMNSPVDRNPVPGTQQYSAPEYFLGEVGSECSDIFSLGVIAYQMLSGKLPYGTDVPKARSRTAQRKLRFRALNDESRPVPAWVEGAIRKAVDPDPWKRYEVLSEFVYDLHHPNKAFLDRPTPPLMERDPVVFWRTVSLILALIVLVLLWKIATPG